MRSVKIKYVYLRHHRLTTKVVGLIEYGDRRLTASETKNCLLDFTQTTSKKRQNQWGPVLTIRRTDSNHHHRTIAFPFLHFSLFEPEVPLLETERMNLLPELDFLLLISDVESPNKSFNLLYFIYISLLHFIKEPYYSKELSGNSSVDKRTGRRRLRPFDSRGSSWNSFSSPSGRVLLRTKSTSESRVVRTQPDTSSLPHPYDKNVRIQKREIRR